MSKQEKTTSPSEAQKQATQYFNQLHRGSIVDTKESLEQSIKVFEDAFKAGAEWQSNQTVKVLKSIKRLSTIQSHERPDTLYNVVEERQISKQHVLIDKLEDINELLKTI